MKLQLFFTAVVSALLLVSGQKDLEFAKQLDKYTVGQLQNFRELLQQNPDTLQLSEEDKQALHDLNNFEGLEDEENHGRELQTSNVRDAFRVAIVSQAWTRIRAPYTSSNSVSEGSFLGGSDQVKVEKIGSVCWITAEETNEFQDWFSNLDSGREDILSVDGTRSLGGGHPGFVKPWNDLRSDITNLMNRICSGTSSKVYAGYSRGGAIVQVMLLAHLDAGIASGSTTSLVTFGSPRALLRSEADTVHNALGSKSHRVCNKGDPVPSLPPGWFGLAFGSYFYHVGVNRYTFSRNGPTFLFSWNIGQHTRYDPDRSTYVFSAEYEEPEDDNTTALVAGVAGVALVAVAGVLVAVSWRRAVSAEKMVQELQKFAEEEEAYPYSADRRQSSKLSSFFQSKASSTAAIEATAVGTSNPMTETEV